MKSRAVFWHYWNITPDQYGQLTVAEHAAMVEVMHDEARANEKAARRARARR